MIPLSLEAAGLASLASGTSMVSKINSTTTKEDQESSHFAYVKMQHINTVNPSTKWMQKQHNFSSTPLTTDRPLDGQTKQFFLDNREEEILDQTKAIKVNSKAGFASVMKSSGSAETIDSLRWYLKRSKQVHYEAKYTSSKKLTFMIRKILTQSGACHIEALTRSSNRQDSVLIQLFVAVVSLMADSNHL
ncbi:hypothetical protein SDJN02_16505, partial [Cucurbita argyrosperma subsp. argyrosperma]